MPYSPRSSTPLSDISAANAVASSATVWRIELWGGLRAQLLEAGSEYRTIAAPKVASLLAFLAYFEGAHRREVVASTFWPDAEPSNAANSFRVTLHHLRKFLEPTPSLEGQVLRVSRSDVQLLRCVQTDIAEFTALSKAGWESGDEEALARALKLARGPFLQGFYDDWIVPQNSKLEEEAIRIAQHLSQVCEASGDVLGALDYARRAATVAPLREGTLREVVRLGVLCGQSEQARREFEAWRKGVRHLQPGNLPTFSQLSRALLKKGGASAASVAFSNTGSGGNGVPAGRSTHSAAPHSSPNTSTSFSAATGASTNEKINPARRPLPVSATPFVGREKECAEIVATLRDGPSLLTLTGPSGMGKTRCALECARVLENEGMAVVWVPLANLPSAALLPGALGDALHCRENFPAMIEALQALHAASPSPRSSPETSTRPLVRKVLMVWDNCEHLSEDVQRILEKFHVDAPFVSHLATSTAPLRLSFERVVPIGSLQESALELFGERARAARSPMEWNEQTKAEVRAICEYLGGMPLAVEIAASRAVLFSPRQILADLGPAMLDWQHPHQDAPARHQNLRAAVDWSARQLPAGAANFWAQCSQFPAPFSLEAAGAVTQTPNPGVPALALRDCSLLGLDTSGVPPRAFWLEPIREWAAQSLSDAEKTALRRARAFYFLDLAKNLAPLLDGENGKNARESLERERAHFRDALDWFLSDEAGNDGLECALELCEALAWFFEQKGPSLEHRAVLETTLERVVGGLEGLRERYNRQSGKTTRQKLRLRARVLEAAGKLATLGGDAADGEAHLQNALDLFRLIGEEAGAASCLYSLGFNALQRGDAELARELCEQSVTLGRKHGDAHTLADALYNLSLVAVFAGDYATVRELSNERLVLHRALGDVRGVAISLENLGLAALFEGQWEAALAFYEGARASFEKHGDHFSLARCVWGAGRAFLALGDLKSAREQWELALRFTLESSNNWALPFVWEAFALWHHAHGEGARAAQLLGAAAQLRRDLSEPLPSPPLQREFDELCDALKQSLGEAGFAAHFQVGSHLSREATSALALR